MDTLNFGCPVVAETISYVTLDAETLAIDDDLGTTIVTLTSLGRSAIQSIVDTACDCDRFAKKNPHPRNNSR